MRNNMDREIFLKSQDVEVLFTLVWCCKNSLKILAKIIKKCLEIPELKRKIGFNETAKIEWKSQKGNLSRLLNNILRKINKNYSWVQELIIF